MDTVVYGGGAHACGIRVGDDMVKVGLQRVRDMATVEIRRRLAGPEGTTIDMQVDAHRDALTSTHSTTAGFPVSKISSFRVIPLLFLPHAPCTSRSSPPMPTAAPRLTGAASAVDAEGHARHGAHLGDGHAATARGGAARPRLRQRALARRTQPLLAPLGSCLESRVTVRVSSLWSP